MKNITLSYLSSLNCAIPKNFLRSSYEKLKTKILIIIIIIMGLESVSASEDVIGDLFS